MEGMQENERGGHAGPICGMVDKTQERFRLQIYYTWLRPLLELPAGGWSAADKTSVGVVAAAEFAVSQGYSGGVIDFQIIEAVQQVVAGMNYDLTIKVTLPSSISRMHRYKIFRKLDQSHHLNETSDLGTCAWVIWNLLAFLQRLAVDTIFRHEVPSNDGWRFLALHFIIAPGLRLW